MSRLRILEITEATLDDLKRSTRRILILTSHGIRTNARWQKLLEDLVIAEIAGRNELSEPSSSSGNLSVTFRHNDYKYFSVFSFLNPFRRAAEQRKFKARLVEYIESDAFDEIHLVGHSFGTHIIAYSLLALGDRLKGKVGTVILAGSVLPGSFPWDGLLRTGIRRLVNECGDGDFVLVLNALLPFGSGLAGRRGFAGITGDNFRNRFFRFGHSGYFEKRLPDGADNTWFMRKYWIPLLLGERSIPYVDERPDSHGRLFVGWLVDQSENMKWLVPLGLASAVTLVFLYLALVWRTNFNLETLDIAGQVNDAVERQQLHGVEDTVQTRQASIDAMTQSWTIYLESFFRDDAIDSLNPPQWERARVAARYSILRKRTLAREEATHARPRGTDHIEISFAESEGAADSGFRNQRARSIVYDLKTASPSSAAMWRWSGPLAGTDTLIPHDEYGFAAIRQINASGLQGKLEQRFSAALDDDVASLWDIAANRKLESWQSAGWDGAKLAELTPCGYSGAAIALAAQGDAYVLGTEGSTIRLSSPSPLAYVIGDRACTSFAAATIEGDLLVWASPSASPVNPLEEGRVRSLEFSASADLLLVTYTLDGYVYSQRTRLFHFNSDGVEVDPRFEHLYIRFAAFSSTGRFVLMRYGDTCAVFAVDLVVPEDDLRSVFEFSCPETAYDSFSLARIVRFLEEDTQLLITRAHRGAYGESHLEIINLATRRTDWLARGSRYDIVSLDATPDGTVVVTTAGDSANGGSGSDRSFYVWSAFAHIPIYVDGYDPARPSEAKYAWLSGNGNHAVVAWHYHDRESERDFHELEIVDLEPDTTQAFIASRKAVLGPPDWGVAPEDSLFPSRLCSGVADDDNWVPRQVIETAESDLDLGCNAGDALLLRTTSSGKRMQLRLYQEDGGWSLRLREDDTGQIHVVSYADGSSVADNIFDFVSDPAGQRIFLSHEDGALTRLDLKDDLAATLIRDSVGRQHGLRLEWIPSKRWLRVEVDLSGEYGEVSEQKGAELLFYDPEGRLSRHYDQIMLSEFAYATSGVFDHRDIYWSVNDSTIEERWIGEAGELELEVLTKRQLIAENGTTISFGCDGADYYGSSNIIDPLPSLKTDRTGRFLGAGILGPTIGAPTNNTEMRLFDLDQGACLGVFRHGDEIHDFGISEDGKLLTTQGLSETLLWHVPTRQVVRTFFGPTRIVEDELGLRIITRANAQHPAVWPIPPDVKRWLAEKI